MMTFPAPCAPLLAHLSPPAETRTMQNSSGRGRGSRGGQRGGGRGGRGGGNNFRRGNRGGGGNGNNGPNKVRRFLQPTTGL